MNPEVQTYVQQVVGDTFTSFANLTGSGQNDSLTGDANGNFIQANAGDDTLDGEAGDGF